MNTDDLLTEFRSGVPLADETTARRMYARATSGRRAFSRRTVALCAVPIVAAGMIAALALTHYGAEHHASGPVAFGCAPFVAVTDVAFIRNHLAVASISFTVGDANYPDASLAIQVVRSDVSDTSEINDSNTQAVFGERDVAMASTGSTVPCTTVSTWSGSVSSSEWSGGCRDGFYRVETSVYPADRAIPDPFGSSSQDRGPTDRASVTGWFRCKGSSGSQQRTGTGPSGATGPTG